MRTLNASSSTLRLQQLPTMVLRLIRRARAPLTVAATLVLVSSVMGCATLPPGTERDPPDHIERFNRAMYKFNTVLDHAVLRPVARGYVTATPRPIRASITRFLGNLEYTKT